MKNTTTIEKRGIEADVAFLQNGKVVQDWLTTTPLDQRTKTLMMNWRRGMDVSMLHATIKKWSNE